MTTIDVESKSTNYTTCLARGTSAWLRQAIECVCTAELSRVTSCCTDKLPCTLNKYWLIRITSGGPTEKRTGHLLMMPESKLHTHTHRGCYTLTSRFHTHGEANRSFVECRQQRSFPNSKWSSWEVCVGRVRPNLQGVCFTKPSKQHSMAWRVSSFARGRQAWWKDWYALWQQIHQPSEPCCTPCLPCWALLNTYWLAPTNDGATTFCHFAFCISA